MKRLLAVCSSADVTGWVKQFDLALPALRERFDLVRSSAVGVRTVLAEVNPDLIHTFGVEAFRAVQSLAMGATARWRAFPKWVASGAATFDPPFGISPRLTAAVSQSESERDWAARLVPAPMQFSVKPAIATPVPASRERVPGGEGNTLILACGGFDHAANLKHVVWAFDTVRYANPQLRLVVLGDGPLRPDVERFARSLRLGPDVARFVGFQHDISPYLSGAAQAWCTHTRGGTKFLLEATAVGVPVVTYRTPDTMRVVEEGVCGLMATLGQPVEIAKAAHHMVQSTPKPRANEVMANSRTHHYPVADLADGLTGVYHTLTPSASPRTE